MKISNGVIRRIYLLIPIFLVLLCRGGWLYAQHTPRASLSGIVIDDSTKQPLIGVNVFLSNTSLGSATNKDGQFVIRHVPLGTYELIVSMIGYHIERKTVRLVNVQNDRFDFSLRPKILELGQVVVEAKKLKGWKKNLKRFEKLFLGQSKNAEACTFLNPEILDFEFDRYSGDLSARADGWLQVENRALGYRVSVNLMQFTANENGKIAFLGLTQFTAMAPDNETEKIKWEERRLVAYQGSLRHFLTALAADKLRENGFVLNKTERVDWLDLQNPNLPHVAASEMMSTLSEFEKRMAFQDYIKVTYENEMEERNYVDFRRYSGSTAIEPLKQVSWFTIPFGGFADVTVSGLQTDMLNPIVVYGYWAWEKFANALPQDYLPAAAGERPQVRMTESGETGPRNPYYIAILPIADSLENAAKYKQAEIEYRKALLFDSAPVEALSGLGRIAYVQKHWADFHRWFRKVLQVDPDNKEARDFLFNKSPVYRLVVQADSLRKNGRLKEAEKRYKRALDRDGCYGLALKGLARIAYKKEKWASFQEWLNKALAADPADTEACSLLNDNPKIRSLLSQADASMAIDDANAAEKLYKKALKINAKSGRALEMLGQIASRKGNWESARLWWEQWVQAEPDRPDANYHFAIACRKVGKHRVLIRKRKPFLNICSPKTRK